MIFLLENLDTVVDSNRGINNADFDARLPFVRVDKNRASNLHRCNLSFFPSPSRQRNLAEFGKLETRGSRASPFPLSLSLVTNFQPGC